MGSRCSAIATPGTDQPRGRTEPPIAVGSEYVAVVVFPAFRERVDKLSATNSGTRAKEILRLIVEVKTFLNCRGGGVPPSDGVLIPWCLRSRDAYLCRCW